MYLLSGNLMAKNAILELWPRTVVARLRYSKTMILSLWVHNCRTSLGLDWGNNMKRNWKEEKDGKMCFPTYLPGRGCRGLFVILSECGASKGAWSPTDIGGTGTTGFIPLKLFPVKKREVENPQANCLVHFYTAPQIIGAIR